MKIPRSDISVPAPMVILLAIGLLPAGLGFVCPPETGEMPVPGTAEISAEASAEGLRAAILPVRDGGTLAFHRVTVTGYTSSPRETDSTPHLTASMTRVHSGCLALSRDLLRSFTPDAPFDFGDWVVLPGTGVFIVEDTMNARWRNRADIWFSDRRQALRWGRRSALLARLPSPPEEGQGLFALGPLAWNRR